MMHETMKKLRVRRQWPRCRARKFAKWFSVDVHDYAHNIRVIEMNNTTVRPPFAGQSQ